MDRSLSAEQGFPDLSEALEFFRTAFDHNLARTEGHVVPRSGVYSEYDEAKAVVDDIEKQLDNQLREVRASLKYVGASVCEKCGPYVREGLYV